MISAGACRLVGWLVGSNASKPRAGLTPTLSAQVGSQAFCQDPVETGSDHGTCVAMTPTKVTKTTLLTLRRLQLEQ